MACEGDYAEVSEKPDVKNFTIDENSCYATIPSNTSRKCSVRKTTEDSFAKRLLFMLFLVVLVFMLGTICACVAFTLEISNLKSRTATSVVQQDFNKELNNSLNQQQQDFKELNNSLNQQQQELNNSLNQQQQDFNKELNNSLNQQQQDFKELNNSLNQQQQDFNKELNNSLNQQQQDFNNSFNQLQTMISNTSFDVQGLMELTQQLNVTLNLHFQAVAMNTTLNALEFSVSIQQLNTSLSSHLIQSFSAINEKIQLLNVSIDSINSSLGSGQHPNVPAASCSALPPSSPSGYYWIRSFKGSAVCVHCDMTRSCGGVTGGWMKVAELDMTNSTQRCPSGLTQRNDASLRTCVRNTRSGGCSSLVNFAPLNVYYSKVCGKIIAYQFGTTDAFNHNNINSDYVDGISLTHGNPRQHIWTFASAFNEDRVNCQCINPSGNPNRQPPSFVRNDFFCDTGTRSGHPRVLNARDPLWNGAGCGSRSTCCSFNTPPWFYKQLPRFTSDDIEIRVCRDEDKFNEDIALSQIELYVQ